MVAAVWLKPPARPRDHQNTRGKKTNKQKHTFKTSVVRGSFSHQNLQTVMKMGMGQYLLIPFLMG